MPLPKGFVSGVLTCSCGAKIKTQKPATATKHPCQCPKCFTILGLSTEQLGTVVKCSQCNAEFRAGTGKSDNAFQDLGQIPPSGTSKTYILPPTPDLPPRTPPQKAANHPTAPATKAVTSDSLLPDAIRTAMHEERTREREQEKSHYNAKVMVIVAVIAIPLVLGGSFLAGNVFYAEFRTARSSSDIKQQTIHPSIGKGSTHDTGRDADTQSRASSRPAKAIFGHWKNVTGAPGMRMSKWSEFHVYIKPHPRGFMETTVKSNGSIDDAIYVIEEENSLKKSLQIRRLYRPEETSKKITKLADNPEHIRFELDGSMIRSTMVWASPVFRESDKTFNSLIKTDDHKFIYVNSKQDP